MPAGYLLVLAELGTSTSLIEPAFADYHVQNVSPFRLSSLPESAGYCLQRGLAPAMLSPAVPVQVWASRPGVGRGLVSRALSCFTVRVCLSERPTLKLVTALKNRQRKRPCKVCH